jgi:hypothetical protein
MKLKVGGGERVRKGRWGSRSLGWWCGGWFWCLSQRNSGVIRLGGEESKF